MNRGVLLCLVCTTLLACSRPSARDICTDLERRKEAVKCVPGAEIAKEKAAVASMYEARMKASNLWIQIWVYTDTDAMLEDYDRQRAQDVRWVIVNRSKRVMIAGASRMAEEDKRNLTAALDRL